jgi:hypothetical protein
VPFFVVHDDAVPVNRPHSASARCVTILPVKRTYAMLTRLIPFAFSVVFLACCSAGSGTSSNGVPPQAPTTRTVSSAATHYPAKIESTGTTTVLDPCATGNPVLYGTYDSVFQQKFTSNDNGYHNNSNGGSFAFTSISPPGYKLAEQDHDSLNVNFNGADTYTVKEKTVITGPDGTKFAADLHLDIIINANGENTANHETISYSCK